MLVFETVVIYQRMWQTGVDSDFGHLGTQVNHIPTFKIMKQSDILQTRF